MNQYHSYCAERATRLQDEDSLRMVHMTNDFLKGKEILTNHLGQHMMAYLEKDSLFIRDRCFKQSTLRDAIQELFDFYHIKPTQERKDALYELLLIQLELS
jgi:hypothetical protein